MCTSNNNCLGYLCWRHENKSVTIPQPKYSAVASCHLSFLTACFLFFWILFSVTTCTVVGERRYWSVRKKIRLIEVKAKCRHLKNRLEKGLCVHSVMVVFSTQLWGVLSPVCSSPLLWFNSAPPPYPLPCVNKCTVYKFTQCVRGGGGKGFWASDR